MPLPGPYIDPEHRPVPRRVLVDFSFLPRELGELAMKKASRQLVLETPDHGFSIWLEFRWPARPW